MAFSIRYGKDIGLTPDMVRAGVNLLSGYEAFTADEEYWAIKVFEAMWAARSTTECAGGGQPSTETTTALD